MKSLRIDLILESEQRSAAPISMKGIARIATVAVPLLMLLGIGWIVIRFMAIKNTERMRKTEWLVAEPQSEEARKISTSMRTNRRILQLVQGWEDTNLRWFDQLVGIGEQAPPRIQLFNLKVTQEVRSAEGKTKRFCQLLLQGKAVGPEAQQLVDGLRQTLAMDEAFADKAADVEVKEFKADPNKNADKEDRLFQIVSRYKTLVLE